MTWERCYFFSLFQVIQQSLTDFITEIEKYLIAALAGD
jgi:hypothetical protein